MSKTNTYENELLLLIFNNTTMSGIGDATGIVGSTAAGSLFPSLHTADPGEAGNQTTNEISYTGYGRPAKARSSGGWTVSGNQVTPVTVIDFGAMSGGAGGTATHWGVGSASSGTGKLLYKGTITPNISVSTPVQPQLQTTTNVTED